jgi:cytoskeletal protein RodZ
MFRRYSKPIYALLTATVLIVSFSLIAQTLLAQQVMVPSQPIQPQSAPTNQTSPSPPPSPQASEAQTPSPTESPSSTPSSEAQITPQPTPNTTTVITNTTIVKTSYTPLPQPTPEAGIAIVSVTYASAGEGFLNRFIQSMVTNVAVINFGQNYLTVTSITMAPNSQSRTFSVVIPPNSTVDIPTKFIPTKWSDNSRFYVVVTTAEGYSATSSEFEFPILDY